MQHDEMIWTVINNQFCSYKTSLSRSQPRKEFCKHPYSITGLCNRSHCPLANSLYATIREENGRVSLYMKTVERAHSPKNLWDSWCPTTAPLYVTYVVFDRYITISPNCHIPHLFDRVVIDRNDEATDTCATHPDNWLLQL